MEIVTSPSSSVSTTVPAEWEIRDRVPMNQVEFDKHFGYITPDVENKLVHHSARFFGRFVRPFTDFSSFWKTLLSFLPILQWLPRYNIKDNLLHDMIGGLMVGVMHVPQGIAYAVLAGVHPVVGLYTSFFPVLAYMLFGTSRHNSIGSFAVVALVTGNAVSNLIVSKTGDTNATHANVSLSLESDIKPIDVTTALCLAIGMTQVIIATIGLDFVTTYLSEQLVAGFVTGAAVHVFVTQLKDITGIYGTPRRAGLGNAILISDSESDQCEEDCFEGMNITVNAFDVCDDLTLSDIEKAPTRFEQIQQALKQNTQRYTADLRPPERVCCVLM